nr:EPIDERMAL PATTERNING FACTOR-like protein 8 [Ipomoea batatas]
MSACFEDILDAFWAEGVKKEWRRLCFKERWLMLLRQYPQFRNMQESKSHGNIRLRKIECGWVPLPGLWKGKKGLIVRLAAHCNWDLEPTLNTLWDVPCVGDEGLYGDCKGMPFIGEAGSFASRPSISSKGLCCMIAERSKDSGFFDKIKPLVGEPQIFQAKLLEPLRVLQLEECNRITKSGSSLSIRNCPWFYGSINSLAMVDESGVCPGQDEDEDDKVADQIIFDGFAECVPNRVEACCHCAALLFPRPAALSHFRPCVAALVIPPHDDKNGFRRPSSSSSSGAGDESYYLLSWKCRCGNKYFQP